MKQVRILVVGCGNMGASHAKAYEKIDGFEICGIVSRGNSKVVLNEQLKGNYPLFDDTEKAIKETQPDAVCISTYPDTHEQLALMAFEHGCHVFMEKPIADSVEGAERVAAAAQKAGKKLVIGYILRHHPSWKNFIEITRDLGRPLVMRMNLNQQSQGSQWKVHQNLLQSLSPIVDCGVHYIDVMCQMTRSKPVQVHAIGCRLTNDIPDGQYNYGQLQLKFEDGSIGWYEAGWGPMMSETAFFVKDVIGPNGSVSILAKEAGGKNKSDSIEAHTQTELILRHHATLNGEGKFAQQDQYISMEGEPDHQGLCDSEQEYFLTAIKENLDLTDHIQDAVNSLKIAFACDESVKTGNVVAL